MRSLLVAGASGAIGIALAAPTIMPKTKAVVINLFMKSFPICSAGGLPSAAGEGDAGADLADRLIDQLHRFFAVTALVRRRGADSARADCKRPMLAVMCGCAPMA